MKKIISLMAAMFLAIAPLSAKERVVPSTRELSPNKPSAVNTVKAQWDIQMNFEAAGGSVTAGLPGTETDGTNIYLIQWNGSIIQKYDMEGNFVEEFTIDGVSEVRDLAFDGTYFYGSAVNTAVFKMDFTNQTLVETISIEGAPTGVRHIAYDSSNDTFWGGDWDSLFEFDKQGNIVQTGPAVESVYGSAYDPYAEGGPYIWLFSQAGSGGVLKQFNIASNSLTDVSIDLKAMVTNINPTSVSGGACSTELLVPGTFSLMANFQQEPQAIYAFELAVTASEDAPDAPTEFMVEAGDMGALTANLSWMNPSVTVGGSSLTELDEVIVKRGGEQIYTVSDPSIGGSENYTDNLSEGGMIDYSVQGVNSAGEGISASYSVWVGPDAPGNIEDLEATQVGTTMDVELTWTNPAVGIHGGYLESIDSYTVERDGEVVATIEGTATSYTDNAPAVGNYSYKIIPENELGVGTSNYADILVNDGSIVFLEDFSGEFPPEGWSVEGGPNWSSSQSNNAGGEAPEAEFGWNPQTIADQYLITPEFSTNGSEAITISYKYSINDFNGQDYSLHLVSSTDGTNWDEIKTFPNENFVGEDEITIDSNHPGFGSETFRVAFLFSGNSYNINYWHIDDVMITGGEATPDTEAPEFVSLEGNTQVVGNDMNLTLVVSDQTGVPSTMEATYNLTGSEETLVMNLSKGEYTYTGTIPSPEEASSCDIVFHLMDTVDPANTADLVKQIDFVSNPIILDPVTDLEYDYTSGNNYVDLTWVAPGGNPNPNPVVGLE
ncbi:MAG: hypothetical protein CSA15_05675, partial [Candidatus Delongbacteria bacterium]